MLMPLPPRVRDTWMTHVARPVVLGLALVALAAGSVQAQVCALPGSDGDATISGTVNTYWTPGSGSFSGSGAIALSNQRGAAATLAEGDLVLVIQMQCANIDSSDSLAYGDGVGGEPAAGYSDPGTCLAGRYQFVRAGAGSSNGTLNLTGSPLTATYTQAVATATTGRRTFQVIRVPQYANVTLGRHDRGAGVGRFQRRRGGARRRLHARFQQPIDRCRWRRLSRRRRPQSQCQRCQRTFPLGRRHSSCQQRRRHRRHAALCQPQT